MIKLYGSRCLLAGLGAALVLLALAGCSSSPYDRRYRAESLDITRVKSVVLHYTQETDARSLEVLTSKDYPVSAHYLLTSKLAKTGIHVFQLVGEAGRAWHAGVSGWKNRTNLNDTSIGIEIVYTIACDDRHKSAYESCVFPEYDSNQIAALIELLQDIQRRYPDIPPLNYVGHADIAPTRKIDPGPRFPWYRLYQAGIGAWYDDDDVQRYFRHFKTQPPAPDAALEALSDIGYRFKEEEAAYAIKAFQAHFIPHRLSGTLDPLSAAVLFALREKYESDSANHKAFCQQSPVC